jgi:hypothetical protein
MKRSLYLAAAALLAALAAPAAALTKADITYDTACGAAGVGEIYAGARRGQVERRDATPGVRVNERGHWATCDTPPDCPGTAGPDGKGATLLWGPALAQCKSVPVVVKGAMVGDWREQVAGYPYGTKFEGGQPKAGEPMRGRLEVQCLRDFLTGRATWVVLPSTYCSY